MPKVLLYITSKIAHTFTLEKKTPKNIAKFG